MSQYCFHDAKIVFCGEKPKQSPQICGDYLPYLVSVWKNTATLAGGHRTPRQPFVCFWPEAIAPRVSLA
jgi:hypothetical protein